MKSFIIIAALVAVASAAYKPFKSGPSSYKPQAQAYNRPASGHSSGGEIPILRQASDINPDGSYSFSYETGNGISAQETGVGGQNANGGAQWTAPDGTAVQFQYTADENGFQPVGSHVPEIPEAIVRALEYIRTHPSKDDQQYARAAPKPSYNKPSSFNKKPFGRHY